MANDAARPSDVRAVGSTDFQSLTAEEASAVRALHKLSRRWPKSLVLFSGNGTLTVRKPAPGQFYGPQTVVADVFGIPNDGGDGGDES